MLQLQLFTMQNIPFEIHITTEINTNTQEKRFITFCSQNNVKPLFIELSRGITISQPMLTKTILVNKLTNALDFAHQLEQELKKADLPVKRLKIEIPDINAKQYTPSQNSFNPYFEWHGKLKVIDKKTLYSICTKHNAHFSKNALKEEKNVHFITIRIAGSYKTYRTKVENLKADLEKSKWQIIKEEDEYCIYDSNIILDQGWLNPKHEN